MRKIKMLLTEVEKQPFFLKKNIFKRIMKLCLVIFLLNITLVPVGDAQQYSEYFERFMSEVDRIYIQPRKNWNLQRMESEAPDVLAGMIGHALRQQEIQIPTDSPLMIEFKELRLEVQRYLQQVAYKTQYSVDEDGNRVTAVLLWNIASENQMGAADEDIEKYFGVDLGQMPSVFNDNAVEASGIIFEDEPQSPTTIFKDESSKQINLLGTTPIKKEDYGEAETLFNAGVFAWEKSKAASKRNDYESARYYREEAKYNLDQACELGYPDACGYMGQDDIREYNKKKREKRRGY